MPNTTVRAAAEGMPTEIETDRSIKVYDLNALSCDVLNLSQLIGVMSDIILEILPPREVYESRQFDQVISLSVLASEISQSLHRKIEDNFSHISGKQT